YLLPLISLPSSRGNSRPVFHTHQFDVHADSAPASERAASSVCACSSSPAGAPVPLLLWCTAGWGYLGFYTSCRVG
uniref:Uncharacterized protein n=1 Tax=Aegilops tauschii subsp. strangulata TaxID=200361 RepID=A0A453L675_AEGTS